MGKNFGEYNRLNTIGVSNAMICPKCLNEVNFHLSKAYSNLKVTFLTFGEYDISYFATCPKCASVFSIDNGLGSQLESDITDFELDISMLAQPKL